MKKALPIVLLALAVVGVVALVGRGGDPENAPDTRASADAVRPAEARSDDVARDGTPAALPRESVDMREPDVAPGEVAWVFRTVRDDGTVVTGVPLAVWCSKPNGGHDPVWTGKSDAHGLARATDLPARAATAEGPGARFAIAPTVPATRPAAAVIDPSAPPVEPFDVVVPATAPFEVELVDADGRAIPLTVTFWLRARHADAPDVRDGLLPEWGDRVQRQREVGAGPVRFDHVAVGAEIGVSYAIANSTGEKPRPTDVHDDAWQPSVVGTGPSSLRIRLADRFAVVAARLVTPDGTPAVRRVVRTHSTTHPVVGGGRTEGDGTFAMLFHRQLSDGRFSTSLRVEGVDGIAGFEIDRPQWGRMLDLGDLAIDSGPIALSGRVLDGEGLPAEGATVIVQCWLGPNDLGGERWFPEPGAVATSAADGSFEVHAARRLEEVMAIARAPAVAGSRMLAQLDRVTAGPFPFGSRDVEIRLPSTGRVRVTLRATDADVAEDVRVGLQAVQAGDRVPAAGGFDGAPPTAMLERVPPGEYHVSIRTRIGVELVRIEHVLVVGGQTTDDPRLRNVALPHLHRFEVMVVGADGESLDDQRLHSRVGIAGRWRTSIGSGNAAMRFVSTEPALRFVVSGLGFCPQELELRPGTTRVELRRAPLLALDLPEIRAAAGTKEVGVRLLPVEVVPGVPRGGASWKLDAAGTVRPELVYSGRFRLEIAIGAQSASLGGVDVDIDRGVATWTLRDPDWREVVQRLVADAGG